MSGITCKLKDLNKSFEKFKAAESGAEERKRAYIQEHRRGFIKMGFSPWQAENLAMEKWRHAHKNDPK